MSIKRKLINEPKIGDVVKIIHDDGKNSEKFWVKIVDIRNNMVAGVVLNYLKINNNYDFSDFIKFDKNNIIEIL